MFKGKMVCKKKIFLKNKNIIDNILQITDCKILRNKADRKEKMVTATNYCL